MEVEGQDRDLPEAGQLQNQPGPAVPAEQQQEDEEQQEHDGDDLVDDTGEDDDNENASEERCWSPLEFVEKIFHVVHHNSIEDDGGDFLLSLNKRCPAITLFFDDIKNMTIACLSRKNKSLDVYFQCRVAQHTAIQRSPLYYELNGYIRDNLCKLRRAFCYPDSIVMALGALAASDAAQRADLLAARFSRLRRHHGNRLEQHPSQELLERVLEIARLHRLEQDLDVVSIYCMRLTSKTFGKIAARLATSRLQQVSLQLTPYVDGVEVSGYSNFVRGFSSHLVQTKECGRKVEYHKCQDIPLIPTTVVPTSTGVFVPANTSSDNDHFSWLCEEIALANLHRWWGDIVVRDYVGHKVILTWKPQAADALLATPKALLPLTTLHLEACPSKGRHVFGVSAPSSRMRLHVTVSQCSTSKDDVSTTYQGTAEVESVHVSFPCLVWAVARATLEREEVARPQQPHSQRNMERRPLLDHEKEYWQLLDELAHMGTST